MESKQDVFEDTADILEDLFWRAEDAYVNTGFIDVEGLRARYAAAGKVAVPREVGECIDDFKSRHYPLLSFMGI